jgi:DNA-binding response OmpR family regulator
MPEGFAVFREQRIVRFGGRSVRLTKTLFSLFEILLDRSPRPQSNAALVAELYWDKGRDIQFKTIDILIHQLRRRLAPLGLEIKNHFEIGKSFQIPKSGRPG